jgi:hypothetical protein
MGAFESSAVSGTLDANRKARQMNAVRIMILMPGSSIAYVSWPSLRPGRWSRNEESAIARRIDQPRGMA